MKTLCTYILEGAYGSNYASNGSTKRKDTQIINICNLILINECNRNDSSDITLNGRQLRLQVAVCRTYIQYSP